MRSEAEVREFLARCYENRKSGLFWSGHVDGEISALEWVLATNDEKTKE
jgi:hypothetical protein